MEFRMEFLTLILCVTSAMVESISISPNGNSPKVKMIGGMMVDVQKGFLPMTARSVEATTAKSNYDKSRQINGNSTKLSLNERYRRLIPYMTFYYANDLAAPPTDGTKNVEVEKAQIVEAKDVANPRQPKKIFYSQRNIPRYQGNRLTQYNIASANPTRVYYKDGVPVYQSPNKVTPNYNPLVPDFQVYDYESGRIGHKSPGPPYTQAINRPYLNLYNEDLPNIRYYLSEKEQSPKYKLVPYEQTPPVKVSYLQAPAKVPYEQTQSKVTYEPILPVKIPYNQHPTKVTNEQPPTKTSYEQSPVKLTYVQQPVVKTAFEQSLNKESYQQNPVKIGYEHRPVKLAHELSPVKAPYESPVKVTYEQKVTQNDNIYEPRKPVIMSVLVPQELYVKPRPVRPSFAYDNGKIHPVRKQPAIVSESYYEKQRPQVVVSEPVIESGFKPIVSPTEYTTEAPIYTSTLSQATAESSYEVEKQNVPFVEPSPATPDTRPNYYQYVVDQPAQPLQETLPSAVTLASLLNSLQVNKSIPKPITRENVASSIRTLLQVLNSLKATQSNDGALTKPVLSTPKPFISANVVKIVNHPEILESTPEGVQNPALQEEPYLAEVNTPSQHLDDDYALKGGQRPPSSQRFPLPITSDDEGGTPGTPGVDYPVLSIIPQTKFDCKTQRYKGFFADTETRCQVWHYCDLNGGQASFLCPNGTIFSQAGLTCDWWFNVRCDSTTQLYVLNESLYKYILPHSPKFPEDYSGPLVDKYLTLKFKEMEEEFKKNKNKKGEKTDSAEEDDDEDDDEEDDADETNDPPKTSAEMDKRQLSYLSEASVIVESPGTSGKVERLRDE